MYSESIMQKIAPVYRCKRKSHRYAEEVNTNKALNGPRSRTHDMTRNDRRGANHRYSGVTEFEHHRKEMQEERNSSRKRNAGWHDPPPNYVQSAK